MALISGLEKVIPQKVTCCGGGGGSVSGITGLALSNKAITLFTTPALPADAEYRISVQGIINQSWMEVAFAAGQSGSAVAATNFLVGNNVISAGKGGSVAASTYNDDFIVGAGCSLTIPITAIAPATAYTIAWNYAAYKVI